MSGKLALSLLLAFLLIGLSYGALRLARYTHHKRGFGLAGYWYILAFGWLCQALIILVGSFWR